MTNLRIAYLFAVVVLLFTSCKETPLYFSDSLKEYKSSDVQHTDTLEGTTIIDEVMGAYSLSVVDSIICVANRQRDTMFSLFSLTGDSLATVGVLGQGPADFTSNRLNGQTSFTNHEGASVWVNDVNASALKRLNLTQSIAIGKSQVDSIIPIRPMVKNAYILGDTLIQEVIGDGNYNISLSSLGDKWTEEEPLYRLPVDFSDLFMFYNGTMAVSPDGKHLVIALSAINQINILELTGARKRLAISVGGVMPPAEVLDPETQTPSHGYYIDLALDDKYIYALYENLPYTASEDERQSTELHVMDYNGDLIAILPLDRFISAIAYSSADNSIYALADATEAIVRYDLSKFIR